MRRSIVLIAILSAQTAGAQAALTPHQRAAREIYSELISINTVDSVGSVTKAAEAMAARFRAAGFPDADVKVLIPPGKPTKGNLVVRYRGRAARAEADAAARASRRRRCTAQRLAARSVHAARGERLLPRPRHERRQGDGVDLRRKLAADDKRRAVTPSRDIILALTADEEGGDANGAEWLREGASRSRGRGVCDQRRRRRHAHGIGMDVKPLFHSVQAAEKVYQDFTLTATNPGGHSSVPRPDNAIYQLADALARLPKFAFPVALNPTTRAFFEQTAKVEKPEIAAAMRAIVANPATRRPRRFCRAIRAMRRCCGRHASRRG